MKKERRILLQVNSMRTYGRGLLKGIGRYAHHHGHWLFFRAIPGYIKGVSRKQWTDRIKKWRPDGVICWDTEGIDELIRLDVPMIASPNVVLSADHEQWIQQHPFIATNCIQIGIMGADYFLDKGFRHFAFCGYAGKHWSDDRREGFKGRIARAGFSVSLFEPVAANETRDWEAEKVQMSEWLKTLPTPVAIMACNDDRGLDVVEAAQLAGLYIPEEVAVLGVDNEEQACEVFTPALSSITISTEQAGYRAAEMLDAILDGMAPDESERWIKVEPLYVVTRQSTDVLAIEDSYVAEAVNFIHKNIRLPLQVDDVAGKVAISRRALEQRFKDSLGRSIYAEIRRIRVTRIMDMLLETQMNVGEISRFFGYLDSHNIARFFHKETGMTLLEYRRKFACSPK